LPIRGKLQHPVPFGIGSKDMPVLSNIR
jgi:hypothetical protein